MSNEGLMKRAEGNTSLVKSEADRMLQGVQEKLLAALPKQIGGQRFMRLLLNTLSAPGVIECTRPSIYKALMDIAASGLEPGRRVYIVPFKDKRQNHQKIATVIFDYRGLLELAYRSGMVDAIDAIVVHANDVFRHQRGSDPKLVHEPNDNDPGPAVGAYCIAWPKGSLRPVWAVMGPNNPRVIKAMRNTPLWNDTPEMGWLKTAVRVVCNLLPQSPEYATAIAADTEFDGGGVVPRKDYDETTGEVIDEPALPNKDDDPLAPAPRRSADEPQGREPGQD